VGALSFLDRLSRFGLYIFKIRQYGESVVIRCPWSFTALIGALYFWFTSDHFILRAKLSLDLDATIHASLYRRIRLLSFVNPDIGSRIYNWLCIATNFFRSVRGHDPVNTHFLVKVRPEHTRSSWLFRGIFGFL